LLPTASSSSSSSRSGSTLANQTLDDWRHDISCRL
jgi:hypothetical protein